MLRKLTNQVGPVFVSFLGLIRGLTKRLAPRSVSEFSDKPYASFFIIAMTKLFIYSNLHEFTVKFAINSVPT